MRPRLLRLHPSWYKRLVRLGKEAEREGAYRVAKRLQAVVLNSEGHTSGELAGILKAPRSKVSEWLASYEAHGRIVEKLGEGGMVCCNASLAGYRVPSTLSPRARESACWNVRGRK